MQPQSHMTSAWFVLELFDSNTGIGSVLKPTEGAIILSQDSD